MPVPIPKLARSIYEETLEAEMRQLFDAFAGAVEERGTWFARKTAMLDVLALALALFAEMIEEPEIANDENLAAAPDLFPNVVPLVVGVVLERLGEGEIRSVEQAAFYVLSAHPEHQEAADRWLRADRRRLQAFRRFLKANRDYRQLFEASAGFEDGLDLEDDEA